MPISIRRFTIRRSIWATKMTMPRSQRHMSGEAYEALLPSGERSRYFLQPSPSRHPVKRKAAGSLVTARPGVKFWRPLERFRINPHAGCGRSADRQRCRRIRRGSPRVRANRPSRRSARPRPKTGRDAPTARAHRQPQNCTRTASPWRVSRTETSSLVFDRGSGITDQSDTSRVTTTLKCMRPSVNSMPALIQCFSSMRRNSPAWS